MFNGILNMAVAPDLAVLILIIAVLIIYGAFQGTGTLVSLVLSLPIAGFIYKIFPYQNEVITFLPSTITPWIPLATFLLIVLFVLAVFQKMIGTPIGSKQPISIIIVASILTILIISFTYHVFPIDNLYNFGITFDNVFGSVTVFFWSVVLSFVALFVV